MKQPKQKKGLLRNYTEGTITFTPTFKYHVGTNEYNWQRCPAYTDRILYESVHDIPQKNPIMSIYYGKIYNDLSDHKPITGMFEAKIKVINQDIKQRLVQKIKAIYLEGKEERDAEKKEAFLSHLLKSQSLQTEFEVQRNHTP